MMLVDDSWFRGLVVTYGPDGGVYVADWNDTGECHNYKVVDQTNGRIYKITSGQSRPWQGDLAQQSDQQLVALQLHPNDWLVRHARRLLQERHGAGKLEPATRPALTGDAGRKCRPHASIARPVGVACDGRAERTANSAIAYESERVCSRLGHPIGAGRSRGLARHASPAGRPGRKRSSTLGSTGFGLGPAAIAFGRSLDDRHGAGQA